MHKHSNYLSSPCQNQVPILQHQSDFWDIILEIPYRKLPKTKNQHMIVSNQAVSMFSEMFSAALT